MSGYAQETAFARSREAFAQAEEWLAGPEAAGLDHAALEEQLAARGREIQQRLLQDHLDARAAAEPRRAQVTGPDGIVRTRAEAGHTRPLASVFGPVRVSRIACRAPAARNAHPADEQLNLPPGKHSHGLSKLVALAAARSSLAAACAEITARTGCQLGTRQCQQLARAAAADFAGFYASRRPPPGAAPGDVLVLELDAKGIAVLPGQQRPRSARAARKAVPKLDGRLSRGEVRTRKRMAEVAAVFDITPVPRTAASILAPGPRPPGPQAAGKWLTASIAAAAADVVAAAFAEADRRDPHYQRTWIALADGNKDQIRWIRAQAAARGITITIVIDVIHVAEYLRDAAWCFFPEASPQAAPWVRAAPPPSWTATPCRSPPPSATPPPPASSAPPNARPWPGPRTTSRPAPPGWTTPGPSLPGGPSPPASSKAPAATWSKTAWPSPAPAGASKPPKPSSSSAPSRPTATSTPTGTGTSHREHQRNHPASYALAA